MWVNDRLGAGAESFPQFEFEKERVFILVFFLCLSIIILDAVGKPPLLSSSPPPSLSINRFRNVPFTFLLQTSIGSVYAWSLFNAPLVR